MNNDRRAFIRSAGVAVTAAVAGSGASAATLSAESQLDAVADVNAINALQQQCFKLMQQQDAAGLTPLFAAPTVPVHAASLLDTRIDATHIEVAPDRQSATASCSAQIVLGTALAGAGTLQQMARLQGQTERQWSETGVYTARYVKLGTAWKIRSLRFSVV